MTTAGIGGKVGVPNTWKGIRTAAEQTGAKFPDVVAAQWALESGYGKHFSGKNNPFGLKGKGTTVRTQEFENGAFVDRDDSFIDFEDLYDSVKYLVTRWYRDWGSYSGINRAATREDAAKQLVAQGYATDPDYATKLIAIMNEKEPRSGVTTTPVKAKPAKLLFRLEAFQDTWLKKRLEQADELGEMEKVRVSKGETYGVTAVRELPREAHVEVELGGGAGTWLVYEPHWRKLQEGAAPAGASQVDWDDFDAKVSEHLTVGEVLQWDKRRKPRSGSQEERNILKAAREFEAIRQAWGKPLGVTSWFRPEPYNQQVGGVPGSRHTTGEAFDIYPVIGSLEAFYQWIRLRWTGGLGDGRNKGFVHCDLRAGGHFVPGAGVRPYAEWTY